MDEAPTVDNLGSHGSGNWCNEHNNPTYIVDLIKGIATVSVETMKIVDRLQEDARHAPGDGTLAH